MATSPLVRVVVNCSSFQVVADHHSGNTQGEIILFEPSTSEHISARTIYDPITSIAPNADCRTYAVGYVAKAGREELG
jgi:hypothetical protein